MTRYQYFRIAQFSRMTGMMITIVQEYNKQDHLDLLRGMYELRAKVFRFRLGWDVTVRHGLERDEFDDESPVYLIHTNRERRVTGSCRLLPTTGATLISRFFSDTLPDAAYLSAPSIWECTRFCVDDELAGGSDGASKICGEMLTQIGVLALRSGIETIIGNFDESMLRLYRRVGCRVDILGSTHRFGRPVYLGAFPISRASVADGLGRFPASSSEAAPRGAELPSEIETASVDATRATADAA